MAMRPLTYEDIHGIIESYDAREVDYAFLFRAVQEVSEAGSLRRQILTERVGEHAVMLVRGILPQRNGAIIDGIVTTPADAEELAHWYSTKHSSPNRGSAWHQLNYAIVNYDVPSGTPALPDAPFPIVNPLALPNVAWGRS